MRISIALYNDTRENDPLQRLSAAVELYLTTNDAKYAQWIVGQRENLVTKIDRTGHVIAPIVSKIGNKNFTDAIRKAVKDHAAKVALEEKGNPYGVPYTPDIWGAGWGIQGRGVQHYLLHRYFPDLFPNTYMLHAINFVLGCHPGMNTASFASGVGAKSLTTAYGFNRADWSYIPGGIGSGTALIRPDYPEMLHWPFLWQQTEYVLGGGTTDYLFLIIAADEMLNKR